MSLLRRFGAIMKETLAASIRDRIPERGAALSFYVVLSLGPLLVLMVGVLEFFLQAEQVRTEIVESFRRNAGPRVAETVEVVLSRVEVPNLLSIQSLIPVALLLFAATAAFTNLRGSLNAIWGIEPELQSPREAALDLVRARGRSFVMVGLAGAVLVISFVATSMLGAFSDVLESRWTYWPTIALGLDIVFSILITGLLFGAIYRTLPAVRIGWDAVWAGAFATAVIFTMGKTLVAWIMGRIAWTSYFGPGTSIVTFLAWIYFSAQIFFVGAEFTQVWSWRRREDSPLAPRPQEAEP